MLVHGDTATRKQTHRRHKHILTHPTEHVHVSALSPRKVLQMSVPRGKCLHLRVARETLTATIAIGHRTEEKLFTCHSFRVYSVRKILVANSSPAHHFHHRPTHLPPTGKGWRWFRLATHRVAHSRRVVFCCVHTSAGRSSHFPARKTDERFGTNCRTASWPPVSIARVHRCASPLRVRAGRRRHDSQFNAAFRGIRNPFLHPLWQRLGDPTVPYVHLSWRVIRNTTVLLCFTVYGSLPSG